MKQSSRKVSNSENLKIRQGTGATTIPGLFLIWDLVDSRLPHFRSEKQTGSSWAWPHTILTIELQIITFNQRGRLPCHAPTPGQITKLASVISVYVQSIHSGGDLISGILTVANLAGQH
nr:uncharacterized protein LOC118878386 [Drosophila suzukii]